MGQTESMTPASVHASQRRVDPRWSHVALEQLRNEEFLLKQLRRMETIDGARQAATATGGRRQQAKRGLLIDGGKKTTRGGRVARWGSQWQGGNDSTEETAGENEDDTQGGARGTSKNALGMSAEQVARMEEKKKEELLHALCLFGNVTQPERTALLFNHLREQLDRACVIPDPVSDLILLRKQILRDILDATLVQHQYQRQAAATIASIDQAIESALNNSSKPVSSLISLSSQKTKDRVAREANVGVQFVLDMVSGLMNATIQSTQHKKELLSDLKPLLEALAPGSLALSSLSQISRMKASSSSGAIEAQALIEQLQALLRGIAQGGHSTDRHRVSSPRATTSYEFDIAHRTKALSCLIHLALATGSVSDLLNAINLLLGVSDQGEANKDIVSAPVHPIPSPPSNDHVAATVQIPKASRMKEQLDIKELELDDLVRDERVDPLEEGLSLVEQKLKQVHKQRGDVSSKADSDDQIIAQGKRKVAPKAMKTIFTGGSVATTVSLALTNTSHRGSVQQSSSAALSNKYTSKHKDDMNNVLVDAQLSLSLDLSPTNRGRIDSTSPTRQDGSSYVACPRFQLLRVGSVLKELDSIKPSSITKQPTIRAHSAPNGLGSVVFNSHFSEERSDESEVWSCGQNSYGELGHGDTGTRKSFERIESLRNKEIVQVSAGNEHSIVLSADGTVWTCGYNDNGQCGLGVTTRVTHMTEVQKLGDTLVSQVHAYNGCEHTVLVTQDGRAASCGYNYRGQLGHGNTQSETVPKIIRSIEGKVVRLVSCSYYHTVLTCDGPSGTNGVYTIGRNDYGQLGHSDTIDRKVPQPIDAFRDQQVVSVACGQYHTMIVVSSGKLYAFGKNDYGQLGLDTVESQLSPVQVRNGLDRQTCLEARCGYYHTIVLCAGAHVFGFGRNDYGQLGFGKASNSSAMNLQLQQQRFPLPQLIEDLEGKDIVRFACGCYHTVVVSDNGVLYVFGRNNHGQLGTGDTKERLYPFPIDDFVGKRIAMVAAGFYHTLVLTGGTETGRDEANFEGQEDQSSPKSSEAHGKLAGITSAVIMSHPAIREYLEAEKPRVGASGRVKTSRLLDDTVQAMNDPSSDVELHDGRSEDQLQCDISSANEKEQIMDASMQLFKQLDSTRSPTKNAFASDSVEVAVIIMAQLDRFCKPHLTNHGFYPSIHVPSMNAVLDMLSAQSENARFSIFEAFEGAYEQFSVQVCTTTFDYLNGLVKYLSSRKIDMLAHASVAPNSTRSGTVSPDCSLQAYMLSVCFRVLRANLLQALRSGVGVVMSSTFRACSTIDTTARIVGELMNLRESIWIVLDTLLGMIDKKLAGSDADLAHLLEHTASDVINTLMVGLELFFPCQCSQVEFCLYVMERPSSVSSNAPRCKGCPNLKSFGLSARAKRLLVTPLLERMSEDSLVVKLVSPPDALTSFSSRSKPVYTALLERVECDFLQALGGINTSEESLSPTFARNKVIGSNSEAMISFLSAVQKHLATNALGRGSWTRVLDPTLATDYHSQVAKLIENVFFVDPSNASDMPSAWRVFLEFAESILAQVNDVFVHVLPREELPSPTLRSSVFGNTNSPGLDSRVREVVEMSIVGRLLPEMISCLHAFTRVPVFAVTLLPLLSTLFHLLDEFNSRSGLFNTLNAELMGNLGFSLSSSPPQMESSRQKPAGRGLAAIRHGTGSSRGDKVNGGPAKISLGQAMSLPWSVVLEKELIVICGEMTGTLVHGDPLFAIARSITGEQLTESASCQRWERSFLFSGGLNSHFLRRSALNSVEQSKVHKRECRVISHCPLALTAYPVLDSESCAFTLVLPPNSESSDPPSQEPNDGRRLYPTQEACRNFLSTMSGIDVHSRALSCALALCQWLRDAHAKKDSSYRMLLRQSQSQRASGVVDLDDYRMESAFLAVLLYHDMRTMSSLLVAQSLDLQQPHRAGTPPAYLLRLWRSVAEMRRRFVTKRTVIKNTTSSTEGESSVQVADLQKQIIERCQLLLLVNIDEEEEHAFYELDGGFIAPWDPALSFRATTYKPAASSCIVDHMTTRYTAFELSFLSAYPSSRWRKVRSLIHTMCRWKAATSRRGGWVDRLTTEVLEFVTADDNYVGSLQFAYAVLIQPCRRLGCTARGYEALIELIHIPSSDYMRVSVYEEIAEALGRRPVATASSSTELGIDRNSSLFYREHCQSVQRDLLTEVVSKIAETTGSPAGVWPLLALLRCWGVHFNQEQFEFVNDVGILKMLLQVEDNLFGGGAASSQVSASSGLQFESIKVISSNKNESEVDSTALNLKSVLAILKRYIAIHFAVQPAIVKGSSAVPTFPALSETFDLLYTESYRVAEPVLELSGATIPIAEHNRPSIGASGALRRSFEIIIAPRRFSPLTKSLEFRYSDMIAPSECSGRLAMSPLLKPNEFSITTWLFVREGYAKTLEDPPLPNSPQLDDRQLIFLRGSAREIFPYMMLTRDMEAQWQIEVGIVMNLRDDTLPNSLPRLMWERLVTKDPIPLRRWTHVAVVLEGMKMRLYINGILDSQRTISASHTACCANGSIDLDFRFGRISSTPIDQHDGRVSGATSAYHFFAALLAANSAKAVGAVSTTVASSLRSFDGLLSHFRFHNRSLSPIHVRIVFDEKKPPKDDANRAVIITNPTSTIQPTAEVQAVLKLHAVLLVLSDSGEGQVHLSQPKWIAHLWDTFVHSNNLLVQRSSLQLLRRVLRHQAPATLSAVLFKYTGAEQGDSLFIGLVFRIVGCCLSIYRKTPIEAASASKEKTDNQTLPVAIDRGILCAKDQLESGQPFELRNNVAEEISNDNCRRLHKLSIANDLMHMLTRLFRDASDKWAQPILTTILRVLERLSVPSVGEKNFYAIEAIGCLYLLGGAMESLRSGADVTITGTDDLGTVVVIDETSVDRIPAGSGQPSRSEVCVSLHRPHLVTEQTGDSPSLWYDQVLKYCSRVTENCEGNSETKFIRLHSDDVQLHSTPSLMGKELLSLDNGDAIVSGIVTSVLQMGIETSFGIEGGACGLSVLGWWHTSGLLIKALKQLVRIERGAAALVRTPDVLVKLVQSAARDNGNPTFATLQELEEKLCIVRSRLYQVLADLGDDATPELEQWLTMKRKHHSSNVQSKGGGDKPLEDSPETLFDLDESDNDKRRSDSETPEPDSGRCVRNPDDNEETSDLQQEREKSRGDESKDDNVEDDDGEGEEDEDDEEDGEDEDEDEDDDDGVGNDEEDTDAEEHRQEFVDELMMMGFPEEWCVLALKQTENDIVSASAWIVDNLEYLSRLQTTLDKQREQSSVNLAFNDDDDDNTEELMAAGDGLQSEAASSSSPQNVRGSEIKTASVDANSAGVPENTSSPLVNDKETGRKVFGEMYFPFEEGGYESNTRYRFFTRWREETIAADASTTLEEKAPAAEVNAECAIDRFARDVEEMELVALLDQILILEHAYRVVCTRQVLVTLWSHKNVENRATLRGLSDIPEILTLTKLLIVRGDQFPASRLHDEYPGIKSSSFKPEQIMSNTLRVAAMKTPSFGLKVLEFAIRELEEAATNTKYEAYLWTQRDLRRCDRVVLEEPSVEFVSWLLSVLFEPGSSTTMALSMAETSNLLSRLLLTLRSANLPIKFLALRTIVILVRAATTNDTISEEVIRECHLDFTSFLLAAKRRLTREVVQHRKLFSLYLQAYIEVLVALRKLSPADPSSTDALSHISQPIVTSFISEDPSKCSKEPCNTSALVFDRKKCRSTLLQISDDGLSVAYSGHEMWKTVVMTHGYAMGTHSWQIRIDKSSSSYLFIGIASGRANLDSFLGSDDQSWGFIGDKALYYQRNRLRVYGDAFGEGDCISVYLDCDLGTLSFSKNGVELGVAFENIVGEVFPAVAFYSRHQKVSIIPLETRTSKVASPDQDSPASTIEEGVIVCEMMDCMVQKRPIRRELLVSAFEMTRIWQANSLRFVITRTGQPLWVDISEGRCAPLGFRAKDRVRTPRGTGTILGVADDRLWVEIDGEKGAWHCHPSKIRSLTLLVANAALKDGSITKETSVLSSEGKSSYAFFGAQEVSGSVLSNEDRFVSFLQDKRWSLALDRLLLSAINSHCEVTSLSPWNLTPDDVLQVIESKDRDIQSQLSAMFGPTATDSTFQPKILARFGFLRYFNAYFSRVVGFFDLSWHYFAPKASMRPSQLVSLCRGSIFTSIKNEFFTVLMEKTANAPKKADDDYDYPDDLPQMQINRPKAATAKCHPGTTKSLLLSMFGQAFEALHFMPLSTLRMVYSHPMDDGQLRSFKVKFEGEGVDDYGGPYREFFSQVFAELQMIAENESEENKPTTQASDSHSSLGTCFLPFLMPSPNWRNGVGSNREKFVINGSILGSHTVGSARVIESALPSKRSSSSPGWAENPEVKRQLRAEMCHFFGQLLGICLRTRVCVRLDLAMSVWKQLVAEDDEWDAELQGQERALLSLKEIDFVGFNLLRSVIDLCDEYSRLAGPTQHIRRRQELEEELAAMDLTFTTYLSDGRLVELCDNGSETPVTTENAKVYVRAALTARMNESREVMNVIKQGINSILPVTALGLLTSEELEKRMCGVAEVDVELLKQNTEYDEDLSPNDEFIQRFWRVLGSFEDEDKRAFLRFVWARSRLPVGTAQFHQKFKIQSLVSSSGNEGGMSASSSTGYADAQLPKSHTCFFALQLPRYSTDEICRKQLLYAIQNCVEMDGDFRLADTEMTGWNDINPNDQLRF